MERDKRGQVVATGKHRTLTEEERFFAFWRERCLPRWRVAQLWARVQADRAAARTHPRSTRTDRMALVRELREREGRRNGQHRG